MYLVLGVYLDPGGVLSPGGCLVPGEVSARGVSALGGFLLQRGVSAPGGAPGPVGGVVCSMGGGLLQGGRGCTWSGTSPPLWTE